MAWPGNHLQNFMALKSNLITLAATAVLLMTGLACGGGTGKPETPTPLKIGLLLNFSSSPETSSDRKRAFDLAIEQVNDAGGVLGRPVEGVSVDVPLDPDQAVEAARRLVEVDGVHAIVGPSASAAALPVSEQVTGPAGIPNISPSATSPQLTEAEDNDFFFRTALSDTAQGPVLARVTREQGFDNVAVIYRDDPYGRGLAGSFEESWDGSLRSVSVTADQTTFIPDLREIASDGAQALVIISFADQTESIVLEALDEGVFDQFVFGDAAKRKSLVQNIGGDLLGDMYGTAGAPAPENAATAEWDRAYIDKYGGLPDLTYVKETYDATIAIALAAQSAGSVEGAAIRDHLRVIASAPGQTVPGTAGGVAEGLTLLGEGQEINYEGAANTLDWDEHGDLKSGYIGSWRFTRDEDIENLDIVFIQN